MVDKHKALAREEIIEALTAWSGVTTADGVTPGNNTLRDSNLIGKNDFITGKTILIGGGFAASYEDQVASIFDNTNGQITVSAGFSAQIKQGTAFRVLNVSSGHVVTTLLNAIKAKTDNLPAAPADEATVNAVGAVATAIQTALGRKFSFLDFWSQPIDLITITTPAVDINFPDIVVAALPTGLTIKKVALVLTCRALNNTDIADNYISAAARTLRVKKAAGDWGVNDVVGITFPINGLYCKAEAKEDGPVFIGADDLSALVNANTTYNVRSDQTSRGDALVAHAAALELYDVQVGLRVFYS